MEKENNPMREYCRHWFPLFLLLFLVSCEEENEKINPIISDYSGSYNIIEFSETLVGNFTPGIYRENEIPEALKEMTWTSGNRFHVYGWSPYFFYAYPVLWIYQ
jgi:hypothetical protein